MPLDRLLRTSLKTASVSLLCLAFGCAPRPGTPSGDANQPGPLVVVDRLIPDADEPPTAVIDASPTPPHFETVVVSNTAYPVLTMPTDHTSFGWHVDLQRGTHLRLGYRLVTPSDSLLPLAPQTRVLVTIADENGKSSTLYQDDARPSSPDGSFRELDLDLGDHEGEATLTFSTEPTGQAASDRVINWYDPMLLAPAQSPRQNVVIICVDTLRADALQAFGGQTTHMPNVEARLSSAVRFTQAYANSSWSLPSMATILTGLLPGEHQAGRRTPLGDADRQTNYNAKTIPGGIELTIHGTRYGFQMLHPSVVTLQEALGSAGLYTAAIHNNGYINTPTHVLQGMDYARQYTERDAAVGTDLAIDWVKQNKDINFFLFLHYIDPHQWPKRIPESLQGLEFGDFSPEDQQRVRDTYGELVEYTDRNIERFLETLESQGLAENTYVVLLADHGERFFEKGVTGSHGGSFYQSVIHVPLAIWGPGLSPRTVASRVRLVDVAPTVLELLNLQPPKPPVPVEGAQSLTGSSLLPLLDDQSNAQQDRPVLSEFVLWSDDQYSLLDGPWKFHLFPERPENALYRVDRDPGETQNLIEDSPRVARSMKTELTRFIRSSRAAFATLKYSDTQIDEQTRKSLQALGYID